MLHREALKLRVSRFLEFNSTVEDLSQIFLGLRGKDKFDGCKAFREVGDFIAHAGERDRGLTSELLSTFMTCAKLRTQMQYKSGIPMTKEDWSRGFKANLSLIKDEELPFSRAKANDILNSIFDKFVSFDGFENKYISKLTKQERNFVSFLDRRMYPQSVFSEQTLFNEFMRVLYFNYLLDDTITHVAGHVRQRISIFSAWKMHNCILFPDTNNQARLQAGIYNGNVCVYAEFFFTDKALMVFPIFMTELPAAYFCSVELHQKRWDFPIDVNSEWKLCRL